MASYKVLRFYESDSVETETVLTGLTLDQAQAHCKDPETSSSTCTNPEGVERTARFGRWFDGWTEE